MERTEIEITGLNTECDMYYVYLDEYYHGLTTENFEDWMQEILDPDDIDWELMDYELELAESEDEKE